MFESKYNKLLTVILVIIVLAIIGLLVFLGLNYFNENTSTQDAANFVENFDTDDIVSDSGEDDTNTGSESGNGDNPLAKVENNTTGSTEENEGGSSTGEGGTGSGTKTKVAKKTYRGFVVNGTMKIPKINFSYPVLEKVTKSSIENSVAVLYGAGLNQPGNTVIIGHNYRNGQFFSNNKKLSKGDKIYVTDYEGVQKTYVIYNKFETTPEDTSFYQRDTNGKAELTLSTCTDDSSARLIIWAKEEG